MISFSIRKSILIFVIGIAVFMTCQVYAVEDQSVSLSFRNADIRVVIEFVSQLTGKNFIVDESVKGKVTLISPSKIPMERVFEVLKSVLTVHGYEALEDGEIVRVVPAKKALKIANIDLYSNDDENQQQYACNIIKLKKTDAVKVIEMIRPLLSEGEKISVFEPNNSIMITARSTEISRFKKVIDVLDAQIPGDRENLYVIDLKHANSDEMAEVLKNLYSKEGNTGPSKKNVPVIVSDSSTNSLIISAARHDYRQLERIIKKLDEEKLQVLVEVMIAEVSIDDTSELGVELAVANGLLYGTQKGFGGDAVNKPEDIANHILTGGNADGISAAYIKGERQIGKITIPKYGVLVSAFQNTDGMNILSAPQILTSSNKQATILVGENLAFIKNAQVTAEGGTVRTFEYRDVGLSLSIIPHISENDLIRLEVNQKVETVLGFSFEGAVQISKREVNTEVTVEDGGTVVLGGLIHDSDVDKIQKVPFLGDLPLLGHLFRKKNSAKEKMNLLVFICPHVIHSQADLERITQERKLQAEKTRQLLEQKKQTQPGKRRSRRGK